MPKTLTEKDFVSLPWKNGGGTTLELYKLSHPTDPEKFLFRLSVAKVDTSGPFSIFEGIDRQLLLLSGLGMRLIFDGNTEIELTRPYDLLPFAGEQAVDCELVSGPITDFNVMVARGWGHARVRALHLRGGSTYSNDRGEYYYYDCMERTLLIFEDEAPLLTLTQDKTFIEIRLY